VNADRAQGGLPDGEDVRLRSLAQMARTLARSGTLLEIVDLAAEEAARVLVAASASISRIEPGDVLRTLVNVGDLGPDEERWPLDEVYRVADYPRLRDVVTELRGWTCTVDRPDDEPEEVALMRALGKAAALGAPIVVDGALWGELYLTRAAGRPPFGSAELAYAEALSAILASGVSRAAHVERLERMARTDPLTRLGNRRAFEHTLIVAREALGAGRQVGVLAVDVDGLKRVNDGLGHAAGDVVLLAAAELLFAVAAELPGTTASRVGGDEFITVTIGSAVALLPEAAARLGAAVLPFGAGLSVGTSCADGPRTSIDELVLRADTQQRLAKAGRQAS